MSADVFRPTFERRVEMDADEAAAVLAPLVEGEGAPYEGQRVGRHFTMAPGPGEHRFYSAHLTIEFEDEDEQGVGGSVGRARFHPKPSMWTLVMAIELGCLTGAMIGSMWGVSQLMLGKPADAFWVVIPLVLTGVGLILGARAAARVDRPSMLAMRDAVDAKLGTTDQATPP